MEDRERDFLTVAMEEEVEFERWLLLFCAVGGIVALILAGDQSDWVTQTSTRLLLVE